MRCLRKTQNCRKLSISLHCVAVHNANLNAHMVKMLQVNFFILLDCAHSARTLSHNFFVFLIVCFTSYYVFRIAVLPHSPGVVYYHLLLRQETRIPGVAPFSFQIGIWDLFVHIGQKPGPIHPQPLGSFGPQQE